MRPALSGFLSSLQVNVVEVAVGGLLAVAQLVAAADPPTSPSDQPGTRPEPA